MSRVPALFLALPCVLPLLLLAAPLSAGELAGVRMDDSTKVGEETLVLNGLGLRKKAIFKIYVAGLYLPAKQSDAAKIFAADTPRRLVMHVLYSRLSQNQLADAWNDCLEANRPRASAELAKSFEQLNGWMEVIEEGGRMTFTYTPAGGTEVQVRDSTKGSIAGKEFADALFACWIGDKPATGALKKGLLGG